MLRIWRKLIAPIPKERFLTIIAALFFAASILFPLQQSFAWTYEDTSWWFSSHSEELAGNMGITITYPDFMQQGDDLDVAVSLEYIKNENAKSNYVIFSDVTIHIRDPLRIDQDAAYSGETVASGIIKPGEHFAHLFTIPASRLGNLTGGQEYGIDLSFTALFSQSTALEIYQWDSGGYYIDGRISPDDLQNIAVLDNNSTSNYELTVGINRPYTLVKPVSVSIDGKSYNITDAGRLKMALPANGSHIVAVPKEIPLFSGIRAVFVDWSDGINGDSRRNERNVTLDKNKKLFAIYKTQYRLDVTSEFGTPEGVGWHDSGSNAAFSVDPLQGA